MLDEEAAVRDDEVPEQSPPVHLLIECLDRLVERSDPLVQLGRHQAIDDSLDFSHVPRPAADAREQLLIALGQHQPVQVSAADLVAEHANGIAGPVEVGEKPPVGVRAAEAAHIKDIAVQLAECAEQVLAVYAGPRTDEHVSTYRSASQSRANRLRVRDRRSRRRAYTSGPRLST